MTWGKLLTTLAALLSCFSTAQAATVYGTALATLGTNKVTSILIKPQSTPMIVGTNLIYAVDLQITTDTNGSWSTPMLQGNYTVTVGGRNTLGITVPDSTNSFNLVDILTPAVASYIYRDPGALVKTSTNDLVFNFLGSKLLAGTGLSITENGTTNRTLTMALSGGSVTNGGLQMATGKILGRATAGSGAIEELTPTGTGSPVLGTGPTISAANLTGRVTPKDYWQWYLSGTLAAYMGYGAGMFSGAANSSFGIRAIDKLYLSAADSNQPHILINTNGNVIIPSGALIITTSSTPASSGATGLPGQIAWDTSYLYLCTATNTWRRISHATW